MCIRDRSLAARAIPWAWFPDEKHTTPDLICSMLKDEIAEQAPLNLNEPVFCKFSALKKILLENNELISSDCKRGVSTSKPLISS